VRTILKAALHALFVVFLTLLTQLGGVAWIVALFCKRRLAVFFGLYVALSIGAVWLAPAVSGRVALPCFTDGPLKAQSWLYCALNRTYVNPEVKSLLADLAEAVNQSFPGTQTLVLDGNFPFLDGFPLLPHLSHKDGEKVDLAFYYRDETGYRRGATRSPIGYFAFERGRTHCPSRPLDLRWDLDGLQALWPDLQLEPDRTRFALAWLAEDPRTGLIFLERHLKSGLGLTFSKVRFQGCRAARHDDHIHLQL